MKKKIFAGVIAVCASVSMTYATNSPIEKSDKETTKVVVSDYGLCQSTYNSAYAQAYMIAVFAGADGIHAAFSAHNYAHSQATRCMYGG